MNETHSKTDKQQTGELGEKLAAKFLKKHKTKILTKNYYCLFGEIDIIGLDKKSKEIVFVEVKTRKFNGQTRPETAVNVFKKNRMIKTAQYYLASQKIKSNQDYRFDIVAVELDFQTRKAKIVRFKYV